MESDCLEDLDQRVPLVCPKDPMTHAKSRGARAHVLSRWLFTSSCEQHHAKWMATYIECVL
jgi:hypothetical protein